MNASIVEASRARAGRRIAELSKAVHVAKRKVELLYGELETAATGLEKRRKDYDERIAALSAEAEDADS
jgi:hypothetical protein